MPRLSQDVLVMIVKKRLLKLDNSVKITEDQIIATTSKHLDKTLTKAVQACMQEFTSICKESKKSKTVSLTDILSKAFTRNW